MKGIINYFSHTLDNVKSVIRPKTIMVLISVWGILLLVYRFFLYPKNLDVPEWFPFSVMVGFSLHREGIRYLFLFLILLTILLVFYKKINEFVIVIGCSLLIVTGNLMQGGFEFAFLQPFYAGKSQYYHDALNVPNVREWLATFNQNQQLLSLHSRTHPPFAVLIHDLFFVLFPRGGLNALAIGFGVISLSIIPIFLILLKINGVSSNNRKLLLILFSVIPAVNIYTVVCLDGVISASSTLFLLGIAIILKKPGLRVIGYLLMALGLVTTNLLTYGGTFLIGIGALLTLVNLLKEKKHYLLIGYLFSVLSLLVILFILDKGFNYNHLKGFITAATIENPGGFRLFADPINYLLTRFEDIFEIAFYLSFGLLSFFVSGEIVSFDIRNITRDNNQITFVFSSALLIIMFLSGAYRTGETARACLFIYPYLFYPLFNTSEEKIKGLIILASIQTIIMQLFINFFW